MLTGKLLKYLISDIDSVDNSAQQSCVGWTGKIRARFKTTIKDLKDPSNEALRVSPVTRGSPQRVPKRSVGSSGAVFAKGGARHWTY